MKLYSVFLCVLAGLALGCSDDATLGNNSNNDWDVGEDLGTSDMTQGTDMSSDMAGDMTQGTDMADMSTDMGRVPLNHRPVAVICDNERPMNTLPDPTNGTCSTHAECTDGDNGRCTANGRLGYMCTYDECFEDSDCNGVCSCGEAETEQVNHCLMGDCNVDADCGANGYCSPSFGTCGNYFGVVAYYCHTLKDECVDDIDCGDGEFGSAYCAFDPAAGKWACSELQCVG